MGGLYRICTFFEKISENIGKIDVPRYTDMKEVHIL